MKKIYSIITLLAVALMGLSLTACSSDDLDTNQFKGGVTLNAFGPNPVMRGGTLRFVGSNLDEIASVEIPGVSAITSIDVVKAGVPSEIRITVPKDGPTEGFIKLTAKQGGTITTTSQLAFEEPIEVTGFSPLVVMPGDIIKIEGDYLNLIYSLAFADEVIVSEKDFVSHDRYYIEVRVPENAQTGKLELYTTDLATLVDDEELAYQIITTEQALEVGVPTTTEIISPRGGLLDGILTAKAGETISLTGSYYNIVQAVKFEDDVEVTDLSISADGKSITFPLPAEAPDGEIMLVCKSGTEVPVATLLTIKPSECVASPIPVKAGQPLTVTGKDMDLVTSYYFHTADGGAVGGNDITVTADKVIINNVSNEALDGSVVLVMDNGEGVPVPFSLVTPTVTGYDNASPSAGSKMTVYGTDLDLVISVFFGEATAQVDEDAVSADGKSLVVTIPMDAATGAPKLNLANGTNVEGPALNINEALFCYITEMPEYDEDNMPEAGDIMTVPVANGDKLVQVLVNSKETQFALATKTSMLTISLPENAKASSKLKLISSNGEIEYDITVKPNTEIITTIWSGSEHLSWSGMTALSWGGYDWSTVSEGTDLVATYVLDSDFDYWQMRFGNGSWSVLPGADFGFSEGNIALEAGSTKFTLTLTQEMIDEMVKNGGLVMTGTNYTLLKLQLVEHISLEETIWKGTEHLSWSGMTALSWGGYNWAAVEPGTILTAYYTLDADAEYWQMRFGNGSWAALPDLDFGYSEGNIPLEAGSKSYSVTLTANTIDALVSSGGLVMTGTNYTLTKLTLQ